MAFAPAVMERTMKVQEVLMQAISGQLTWLEAGDILDGGPAPCRAGACAEGSRARLVVRPRTRCGVDPVWWTPIL